ncbi:HTH-type transcriptional repressor RspR [Pandoraea iniqua]|uniref:HTH-type transcriptional repressor RspR n=2 Tax=Pandoraea iniqua TaxID=2508288 RepID=A0A5E4VXH2_9BURK|nr:GntR family transcriptional regulator [Pandoraea iniqua]VVE16239.1 HTH-type transcriptional repressor RspR [Pandoraea iniqua]VVE28074.1 HTH-type transcriptional repressor RspR [Pandoraea iniqua]
MLSKSSHLFDQVHDRLWDLIIKGEVQPGERLKDVEWAGKLGVSRTPVREAMRKLQQEGVLLPLSAGGYQVKNVSNRDMEELYTCRAALEQLATLEASRRLTQADADNLTRILALTDAALSRNEIDEIFRLNSEFHKAIFEFAANNHLIFLWESLNKLVLFYRSALLNKVKQRPELSDAYLKRLAAKQDAHRSIVKAMVEKRHTTAAELMEAHVLASIQELAQSS